MVATPLRKADTNTSRSDCNGDKGLNSQKSKRESEILRKNCDRNSSTIRI